MFSSPLDSETDSGRGLQSSAVHLLIATVRLEQVKLLRTKLAAERKGGRKGGRKRREGGERGRKGGREREEEGSGDWEI